MKKGGRAVLAALCICILAASVLQIKPVALADGKKILVYTPLTGPIPGGSAYADLLDELSGVYGKEGVKIRSLDCQGAVAYDISNYKFEYLGRRFQGGDYILCTINTVRTFMSDGESREPVQDAVRICTYVGYDDADLNSRVRAEILWDTLKVEYPGGEARFSLTDLEP